MPDRRRRRRRRPARGGRHGCRRCRLISVKVAVVEVVSPRRWRREEVVVPATAAREDGRRGREPSWDEGTPEAAVFSAIRGWPGHDLRGVLLAPHHLILPLGLEVDVVSVQQLRRETAGSAGQGVEVSEAGN